MSGGSQRKTSSQDRLDGWKDIAAYLGRNERTLRRWEAREGLPIHRLVHDKRSSVYAYREELDDWRSSRTLEQGEAKEELATVFPLGNESRLQAIVSSQASRRWLAGTCLAVLIAGGLGLWQRWSDGSFGLDEQSRNKGATRRTSPEAMVAYQTALYEFNRGAFQSALSYTREAVRLDPSLAPAHELLGMTLQQEADFGLEAYSKILPEARASLHRALELEPGRGKAFTWLGETYFFGEHEWVHAEENMKRGFALEPGTGNNYGALLAAEGRYGEAIAVGSVALRSDPANPILVADVARLYQFARRYDESIRLARRAILLDSGGTYARQVLTISLFLANQRDDAFEAWLETWSSSVADQGRPDLEPRYREAYRKGGWEAVWAACVEDPSSNLDGQVFKLWSLAFLNRRKEAMDLLEDLEQKGSPWMVELEDPIFDPIHRDSRFVALLKRVGYPESQWR